MSAASDRFERDIAESINDNRGVAASRPKVPVTYADVRIDKYNNKNTPKPVWVEVKMNHTDNLGNTRVFFDGKKWDAAKKSGQLKLDPIKAFACKYLQQSAEIKKWIAELGKMAGIKNPKIPTTKGGLNDPDAIPLDVMRAYFAKKPNQYILNKSNVNLGELVTRHYLEAKTEPAYYIQAADDFYMIGRENPLKLSSSIPQLTGRGDFKMRISLRSEYYEIQPEIKITNMGTSSYSCKFGTNKKNPFAESKR